MTARRLVVAIGFLAATSHAAGRFAGEAWNNAERRAFLVERTRLLDQFAPPADHWSVGGRQPDLYGNPFTTTVDSYQIDASGDAPSGPPLAPRLLKLGSPEG